MRHKWSESGPGCLAWEELPSYFVKIWAWYISPSLLCTTESSFLLFFFLFSSLLAHYWCKHLLLKCTRNTYIHYIYIPHNSCHAQQCPKDSPLFSSKESLFTYRNLPGKLSRSFCRVPVFFPISFWQISAFFVCFYMLGRLCKSLGSSALQRADVGSLWALCTLTDVLIMWGTALMWFQLCWCSPKFWSPSVGISC